MEDNMVARAGSQKFDGLTVLDFGSEVRGKQESQ
jgi:hypothetical protein